MFLGLFMKKLSNSSGKNLVLAVLALFGSKIHCMWRQNGVFGGFWPISSNILMLYGQVLLYEHNLLFISEKMNLKL